MNKFLAVLAIFLTSLALFFGEFEKHDSLVKKQQISVYDLALKIKQRENFVLVDLRPSEARQEFSIPTSMNLIEAQTFLKNPTFEYSAMIIYGHEGNRHWLPWHKAGFNLLFLNNGVEQWLGSIMSPVIYRLAPEHELRLFEKQAEISRYFGGLPRYSDEPVSILDAREQLEKIKRRGCGF